VDLRAGELRKNGLKIRLSGQPFQILSMLSKRPGEVVTREQLQKKLWPDGTFVDFDHSLNTAVNKIRETLGDSAENPRFVETLARQGYRFIAPVEKNAPGPLSVQLATGVVTAPDSSPEEGASSSFRPENNLAAIRCEVGKMIIDRIAGKADWLAACDVLHPDIQIFFAAAVGGIRNQCAVGRNDAVGGQAGIRRESSELAGKSRF
jgi:DNA-binding winged helix-turn-helix (wHTH) protein